MASIFYLIITMLIISLASGQQLSSTKPSYKELIQNHTVEDYNYLRPHNPLEGRKHKRQLDTLNDLLAEMAFPNSDFKRDLHSGSSADLTEGDLWYRHFQETEKHSQFDNANNDELSRLTRQSRYENSNNNPTIHINVNEMPPNYFDDSDDNDDLTIRFDRDFHGELLPLLDKKENLSSKNDNIKYEDQMSYKKNTLLNEPDQKLSKIEQDESENKLPKKPQNLKTQKPIKNSPKRHITSKDEIKILKSKLMLKRFDRDKLGPLSQMPNNNVNVKKIHKDNSNPFWYQNEDEAKTKEKESMMKNFYNRRKLLSTYENDPVETEFESEIDNKGSFEYDDKETDNESVKNLRNVESDELDESNVNNIINKSENDEQDSVPEDLEKQKPIDSRTAKDLKIDKSQLPENLVIETRKDPKKLYNINIYQNISKDPLIDLNGAPIKKNKRNEIKNDLEDDRTNPIQTFQNFLNDIIALKTNYKRESLNEELEHEFTGKMANKIAQEIVNLARSNILLRQYFEDISELDSETRQVPLNNQTKGFHKMNEGFHKIESMLQQIIETINSKPEKQSCTPLPKDLQEFYDQIIEVRNLNFICRQQKRLNTETSNSSNKISKRHHNPNDISPELLKKVLKNYDQRSNSNQNDLKNMLKINYNKNYDDLEHYSDNLDIKKRMMENNEKTKINYENFSKNNLTEQFIKLSKTVNDYKNLDIIRDF